MVYISELLLKFDVVAEIDLVFEHLKTLDINSNLVVLLRFICKILIENPHKTLTNLVFDEVVSHITELLNKDDGEPGFSLSEHTNNSMFANVGGKRTIKKKKKSKRKYKY